VGGQRGIGLHHESVTRGRNERGLSGAAIAVELRGKRNNTNDSAA
jgi:hypothetical protein